MEKLLEYLNAERGRRTKLALSLDIGQNAISQWTQVPPTRVSAIAAVTGLAKHELRPDLFDAPAEAAE